MRTKRMPDINSKMPPQAIDLEEAVLGALLIGSNAFHEVNGILSPESFYRDSNGIIYDCITKLHSENKPVDILTVTERLRKDGKLDSVGGAYQIAQLTDRIASDANVLYHAQVIAEKFMSREIIRISGEAQTRAFNDEDPFDIIDDIENGLTETTNIVESTKPISTLEQLLNQERKLIIKKVRSDDKLTGITTGSYMLNKVNNGWQKGDLVILAARPSVGKSTRMLNFALSAAKENIRVIVFSLEMSAEQMTRKILTSDVEIYADKIQKGELQSYELQQIDGSIDKLKNLPIHIIDRAAINLNYIKSTYKNISKKYGDVGLVCIDYLQLMSSNEKTNQREQEISSISRGLKIFAKDNDIPIIALSQLSRKLEERADKRPMLSDLRESGAIEQDADQVLFLYRPSVHYPNQANCPDEQYKSISTYETVSELWIAKNRHGMSGKYFNETFIGGFSKFVVGVKEETNDDPLPF